MLPQQIYGLILQAFLHVGLALWIYNDTKLRDRSILWVVGTFIVPEAFFPLYFWNTSPQLIWICPDCQRQNRAWSRQCRRCNRTYTVDETANRLHGYFEPSDPFVIFLVAMLIYGFAARIGILITDGEESLKNGVDIQTLIQSLPNFHFWIIQLITGNVLIWLCLHCITVRYRRSLSSVGLRFGKRFGYLISPLLLAPILILISEGTTQSVSWISHIMSLAGLDKLIEWEQQQQSIGMPEQLGDPLIILTAFVLVILLPFGEEMLFRGIAYPALSDRFGQRMGLVFSALLFAVFSGGFLQMIPAFINGIILGLLIDKTRSLIPSIMTHSLMSLISLVMWFGKG